MRRPSKKIPRDEARRVHRLSDAEVKEKNLWDYSIFLEEIKSKDILLTKRRSTEHISKIAFNFWLIVDTSTNFIKKIGKESLYILYKNAV